MLFFSIFLGLFALLLSASFSGAETAFYRIPKLRLKLDAMESDRTARKLLRFVNNPGLFVSTILVGNNIANYTISFATVLFVGALLSDTKSIFIDIGSTLILAPFLFIYGEMFPKYLCLRAPNRMLRLLTPVIQFCYYLFLPITAVLWLFNAVVSKLLGISTQMIKLSLGRQELSQVLEEGQETGLLFDIQRKLADRVFATSGLRITQRMLPCSLFPVITQTMKPAAVLDIARKHRLTELPVYESGEEQSLPVGYVRTIDLELAVHNQLDEQHKQLLYLMQTELPLRSTAEIAAKHTLLTGMILMHTLQSTFGAVVDDQRQCIGFVCSEQLRDAYIG
jgi:CBS domain containing-hemolysin-like protein